MPLHECGWCLVERAPELWFGIGGFVTAAACTLWAAIAAIAVRGDRAARDGVLRGLLGTATLGFAAALTMAAVERWVV